jgi:K+/H+ antiporter YhaU regulatory subunit KhtT
MPAGRSATCACGATRGAVILAVQKRDGSFAITPDPDAPLDVGDTLVAVGTASELQRLEHLFAPSGQVTP